MDTRLPPGSPSWRTAAGLTAVGFGAVAALFLFTEHQAHLFGVLPFLLLLACPLMMMFMHHGHENPERHDHSLGKPEPRRTQDRAQP